MTSHSHFRKIFLPQKLLDTAIDYTKLQVYVLVMCLVMAFYRFSIIDVWWAWSIYAYRRTRSTYFVKKHEFQVSLRNPNFYQVINLAPSAAKLNLNSRYCFIRDNDPKHFSLVVKQWLFYNVKKVLPHLPQSPDLNPIVHLWAYVETKIRKSTDNRKN